MNFVLFCHSLASDWNNGNAHFLRGVVRELLRRGHGVSAFEPRDGWSRSRLSREIGGDPLDAFRAAMPGLDLREYDPGTLAADDALDGADVVLVHEWSEPELVERIGRHRIRSGRYILLFHDTHHRAVSATRDVAGLALDGYDGVLAFGEAVRDIYLRRGWAQRAWVWHEAADTATFFPRAPHGERGDLVWIGNWGDEERSRELDEFLIGPASRLNLRTTVHGVRYPEAARETLRRSGVDYRGYLANVDVPRTFARFMLTVHVPRRQYATVLEGIPTIRVFEALACGIPLVSAPWRDSEGLFRRDDFLFARDGADMERKLRALREDPELRMALARNGLDTIRERHTCAHRVDELLRICGRLRPQPSARRPAALAAEAR